MTRKLERTPDLLTVFEAVGGMGGWREWMLYPEKFMDY